MDDKRKTRQADLVRLFNQQAPIAQVYGMTLSYDSDGSAVFDLPYNPRFDHALGGIHGGVFATLLDNAGWFTVAQYFDHWIATVDFNVHLLKHAKQEHLRARGKAIRIGKTLSVAEMEVTNLQGERLAVGTGTFTLTGVPIQAK